MPQTAAELLNSMALTRRDLAAQVAFKTISSMQDFPRPAQVAGVAVVFLRMCHHAGIRPSEVMAIAENIFTDGERVHPVFGAVDLYIQGERIV